MRTNNDTLVAEATMTLKLIVVENDPSWKMEHEDRMRRFGFNVLPGVSNKMDLLRILMESDPNDKPDVVLLDLIMDAEKFSDVTAEQWEEEIEEGFHHMAEGERLLEMLNYGYYELAGSPIFIIVTTSKSHNYLMDKYPDIVFGILSKSIVDEDEIKRIIMASIRKKDGYGYFNIE